MHSRQRRRKARKTVKCCKDCFRLWEQNDSIVGNREKAGWRWEHTQHNRWWDKPREEKGKYTFNKMLKQLCIDSRLNSENFVPENEPTYEFEGILAPTFTCTPQNTRGHECTSSKSTHRLSHPNGYGFPRSGRLKLQAISCWNIPARRNITVLFTDTKYSICVIIFVIDNSEEPPQSRSQ